MARRLRCCFERRHQRRIVTRSAGRVREAVGSQRGKRGVINARRKAMAYPGTRKLPCPGITRREASLRGDTSLLATRTIYGLGDEADPPDHPLPALDGGSTSRRFVHRARQRLSKLFIANITFYSRRTAAARRPDGTSAVSRDGGCGEKRREKKNERTGHELLYDRSLRECETRRAYE